MVAQLIEMQVADFGNWGLAAALSVVLLAGTGGALIFVNRSLIASGR
jgi:ABC-type spermidine/putrescine transport system permease subunit I